MDYESLLKESDALGLIVKEKPLKFNDGRIKGCKIAIRKDIPTSIEKACVLSEELGHYYCNALYYLNSDDVQKKKCEYRAMKWAYSILVPLQKLKEKLKQGFNLYDLADYFNVDLKYMIDCIDFYVEKYGVLV